MQKINEYSKLMHFQTFLFDDTDEGFNEMVEHEVKMKSEGYDIVNTKLQDGKRRVHYVKSNILEG